MNIEVIHEPSENEPFVVLSKPAGLPSAPLHEYDDCALNRAVELFPQIKNVCGRKKIEYGLTHRLDTQTSGLILIAASQEFYDYIQDEQINGRFIKQYSAQVDFIPETAALLEGFPPVPGHTDIVISRFRGYGSKRTEVRPVTDECSLVVQKKADPAVYSTNIQINGNNALCTISRGYRHQVRCHLAWCGMPVHGDKIYNPEFRNKKTDIEMMFKAVKISFRNYSDGKEMSFEAK